MIIHNHLSSTIMNSSDSIVIIPTYNEKENIEKIVRAVFALDKCFHILVIDDGSPDGTAVIVHRLIDTEFADRLFIIERQGKLGLGTAYIAGFKWALEHSYDYVFEMDADFSHDPAALPRRRLRCGNWLALYHWRKRGELANRQSADELFRIEICALCHRIQG